MDVVITEWALQSYLELLRMFTIEEYKTRIRPDAERLASFPKDTKFEVQKFWGCCRDRSGNVIHQGYKMKWHNIGPGRVQLRLLVVIAGEVAYLCNAYVKENEKVDFREMAKLKNKIKMINEGKYIFRGRLA